MLTVEQLIEHLKTFHPETPVFIPGYEGGVQECVGPKSIEIAIDVHDVEEWWYGKHEEVFTPKLREKYLSENKQIIEGIIII